ncbi:MAG: hypothetical protein WCG63_09130 [Opitutaceae bacterium]
MIPAILAYTLLAYLVAFFGRNRKLGFWMYFLLAFIFTPLLSFLFVLASDKQVEGETKSDIKSSIHDELDVLKTDVKKLGEHVKQLAQQLAPR